MQLVSFMNEAIWIMRIIECLLIAYTNSLNLPTTF